MQLTNAIALTFVAGAYAAMPAVEHVEAFVRDITTIEHPRGLMPRKDDCQSAAKDFTDAIKDDPPPTPDADLEESLATYYASNGWPTATGCDSPSITGDVGSAFTDYSKSFMGWWSSHTTDFQEVWTACSDMEDFSSTISELASGCSSLIAEATGTSDAAQDGGDEDAAPRQTGVALVAAGVAAAVAMAL